MAGFSIRAFAPEDWDGLCDVYERAANTELDWCRVDRRAFRPLPDHEDWEAFRRLNTAMVACVEGSVVGFVEWRERGEWRDSGYLSWLYVDPAHHRQGIGDRLLTEAMVALGEQAWTLAKLGNEPAIQLYRKHGMRVVKSGTADAWGYPYTEIRMAVPTSRKNDPDVPDFGGWIYGDS